MIKELFLAAALFFTPVVADAENWVNISCEDSTPGAEKYISIDTDSVSFDTDGCILKYWTRRDVYDEEYDYVLCYEYLNIIEKTSAFKSIINYSNGKPVFNQTIDYLHYDPLVPGSIGEFKAKIAFCLFAAKAAAAEDEEMAKMLEDKEQVELFVQFLCTQDLSEILK